MSDKLIKTEIWFNSHSHISVEPDEEDGVMELFGEYRNSDGEVENYYAAYLTLDEMEYLAKRILDAVALERKRLEKEKPSKWTTNDENLLGCALEAVKQESKVRKDGCLDEEVGEMVTDWLKSFKPQK